jgi:hypothetical protein
MGVPFLLGPFFIMRGHFDFRDLEIGSASEGGFPLP